MADPKVKLKRSAVAGRIPSPDQVPLGELALNTWDGQLYASRNVGVGTSVVAINPWIVGTGTDSYNIYYTAGNAGIGTTIPRNEFHVNGDIKIDRHLNVTGIVTASSFVGTLTGTATGLSGTPGIAVTNVTGFGFLRAPHSATTTVFKVTVASKDATHRYNGTGSGSGYLIDGVQSPFLTLTPGRTYRFDQSDSSNSSHPLRFYLEVGKTTQYSTNVTTNGTAGSAGAYTEITVTDTTPSVLHYQCSSHANMGNAIFVSSNALTSPHAATIKNYLTVDSGANLSGVTTLATASATSFTATSTVVGSAVTLNSGGIVAGLGTFNSFRTTQLSVSGIATVTSGGVLGNIQVGKTGANEIDTSSGGLTIDSNGGVVTVDDYLGVNQGLSVTGISTLGHTIAGSAVTMTSGGVVAGLGTINYVDVTHLNATGVVTANSFVGDGSGLTGVTGTGSGIAVKDGASTVGTAGTVDFGTALSVTPLSVGIVTVNLANTAVTAGDYTNADITVDAQGRITAASNGSGGGSGVGYFVQNSTGIHTIGNVGIGTTTANGAADSNNTTILNAGIVTANYFYGDGSNITGVVAASSGIIIRDSNSLVGTAATVNFGTGLSVTAISAGIVTVSNLAKTSGVDRTETSFTATAGQTTFTVSYDILNPIDVFLNGIRLKDTTDYTATNGTSIVLTSSAAAGDSLVVMEYFATTGTSNEKHAVDRKITEFSATAGQTTFSVAYTVGNIDVFFNGVRLLDSDVTASNGTSVVLGSAAAAGDQVVVVEYLVSTTGNGITGQTVTTFNATHEQTTFNVSYIIGAIQVYRNGIRLVEDSDYTANTGTSVVLTSGANTDDKIVVVESQGLFGSNQTGINTTSNLGIGTTSAYNALTVVGDANISGVLTATTLYGNGANLTGIQAGFFVQNQTGIHTIGNVGIGTTSAFDALSVTGDANITGVVTATSFTGDIVGDTDITGNVTIISTDAGSSAEPELKLYRNSASPADADYLGQIKFAGESDTGVERNYAKITGKILDASNGTEDGIIEFAHIKAGSQTITARFRSDSLQLLNSTSLTVNGSSTFTGNILAASDSTVDIGTNSTRFANVYADTYYGDGSNLTGISASGGGGVGIALSTYNVGYGQTTIEFVGSGVTVVSIGNTAQVTIEPGLVGAAKSVTSFTATAGQTAFNVDHSTGQENVFLNGVRLSESQYTTNGSTITLNDAAALGDVLDIIVYLRGSDPNRNIEVNLRPPFNGVTTAFTMYRGTSDTLFDPVDARQILVSLGGVVQHPGIAYTVGAGSSIYFAAAPGAGNTCFITGLFSTQSGISTDATKIETQLYTPTGVQTSFTLTRGYEQNYLDVYVNGARLVTGQDYTATDSSTFSLTSPAQAGDTVEAIAFRTVGITSAVTAGISSNVDGNYVNTTHLRTSGISTFGGVGAATTQTITVYSGVGVGQTYVGLFIGGSRPDDTQTDPALYVKGSSQGIISIFDSNLTDGGHIEFRKQGTTIADLGSASKVFGAPAGDSNHFGINARLNRSLIFGANNQEKMRIVSGGNIGIGTTNPEQKLHVAGNLTLGDPNGADNTYIDQKQNGSLEIINSGRTSDNGSVRINRYNDTGSDTTYFRDFLVYNGKNSLVLEVDGSTDRVGINTSAPSHTNYAKLFVQGSQKGISIRDDSGTYRAIYMNSSGNLYFYNGSNEGYLNNSGAWTNASDERLKQNIRPIGYGLTTALSLTPRHYEMLEGGETNIGFIAQEVEEIVPEVVSSTDSATGYKGLDYGSLVAIAIKSIQELKEQNDAYLARIQALEAQVGIAST